MKVAITLAIFLACKQALLAQEVTDKRDIPTAVPAPISLAGSATPDISRFLNVRSATDPRVSPDGRSVAFRTDITGVPQVWVVDAQGGWPKQLTFGEPVTFHEWSPAGDWILYGSDQGGNEREGYYLISPDGQQERELLAPSDAFRIFGEFTRDGRQVTYAATDGGTTFDIYSMEVGSGIERRIFRGRMGLLAASWRPDGRALILVEMRGEDANDVFLLDLESQQMRPLFQPKVASRYTSFAWVPDGSGFYCTTNQEREFQGLAHYSLSSGQLTYLDTPPGDVEAVALSKDGQLLSWIVNNDGYSEIHARRRVAGQEFAASQEIDIPELPKGVCALSWAADAHVAAISVSGPQIAGDIWTWNADTGNVNRATYSATGGLDMDSMIVPQLCQFAARDGVTLHGLLYIPRNTPPAAKPPVLLTVHGGPTAQARPQFEAVHQYLLTRGIAIFDLNYRGSTGYGKSHARLNDRRLRAEEYLDMADAIEWLRKQGTVDASRAAVMGGSYGGYLTMAALTRLGDQFDAGVAFVGVSNWVTAMEGAAPIIKASDRVEFGDIENPDDRDFFRSISPIAYVGNVRAPMMILHGANDPRDPVMESDEFVRAIRDGNGHVEYLRFPDEGHGIRKLSNRIIAYRRIAKFLEARLVPARSK